MLKIELMTELLPVDCQRYCHYAFKDILTSFHVPNNGKLDLIRKIFLGALCDLLDEALGEAALELRVFERFAKH